MIETAGSGSASAAVWRSLIRPGLVTVASVMLVASPVFWLLASFQETAPGHAPSIVRLIERSLFYCLGAVPWFLVGAVLYAVLVAIAAALTRGWARRLLAFLLMPVIVIPLELGGDHLLGEFPVPALVSALVLGWLMDRRLR
jgi:hypothetical protein